MKTKHDRHHRKSKGSGGSNEPRNISVVPRNKHIAFHLLFGAGNPHEIARLLNQIWIDPDYRFVVIEKKPIKKSKLKWSMTR